MFPSFQTKAFVSGGFPSSFYFCRKITFLPVAPLPALIFHHPLLFAPRDEGNNQKRKIIPGNKTDLCSLIVARMTQKIKGFIDFHMNIYLPFIWVVCLVFFVVVGFGFILILLPEVE